MKALTLFLVLGGVAIPALAGENARTFVQATILGRDVGRATLTFVDASGRQRLARATGEALSALPALRPGDQAILSLATEADAPVVTRVRVHRAEPAPAAATPATPLVTGSTPARRSWPNPYARPNRGHDGSDR